MKKVAVIILTYNSENFIEDCINSLQKGTYEHYDIIVVDNASKDSTVDIIKKEFPTITLLEQSTNTGFSRGNNIGITFAQKHDYDYFVLLNHDTTVQENFLEDTISEMEELNVHAMCPAVTCEDKETIWWDGTAIRSITQMIKQLTHRVSYHTNKGIKIDLSRNDTYEVQALTGCDLFLSSTAIKDVGLLNEKFKFYGEDVDWSFIAHKKGYKTYCTYKTVVQHRVPVVEIKRNVPFKQKIFYVKENTKAHMFLIYRHFNLFTKIIWPLLLPLSILKEMLRGK